MIKKLIIILFIFVILFFVFFNHTRDKRINWSENRQEFQYEATFDYFNGKQKIPIQLKKNQTLKVNFLWNTKGGTISVYVLNPFGLPTDIGPGDTSVTIHAGIKGTYNFVIRGVDVPKGDLKLSWSIN